MIAEHAITLLTTLLGTKDDAKIARTFEREDKWREGATKENEMGCTFIFCQS